MENVNGEEISVNNENSNGFSAEFSPTTTNEESGIQDDEMGEAEEEEDNSEDQESQEPS